MTGAGQPKQVSGWTGEVYNPLDPDSSLRIARNQILLQSNSAVAKAALFTSILGVCGALPVVFMILGGQRGYALPALFAAYGSASSLVMTVLARRQLLGGLIKYLAFGLFVSMPTLFFLASHFFIPTGAATYLNGPMVLVYFPILVVAGFMLDVRLAVVTGLVASVGYVVCAVLAFGQLALIDAPGAVMQNDLRDPAIYGIKGFMIAFCGLVVAAFALLNRKLVLSTVQKAYERGNYRLTERIGSGGMGEVWAAEHEMLARPAAVSIIRTEALGGVDDSVAQALLSRFELEAQATARLRSPHTIEVYDFGLSADGTFYYVMELLDGMDLDTLVDQHGPQSAGRVICILKQVCASLSEAHDNGLIHRDIKPANVFVCRYGPALDFVKVLDFGLVKGRGADEPIPGSDDAMLTGAGDMLGTPAFMAPELIGGSADVSGAADIYALGCVAFWLLTGRLVFQGETAVEVLQGHLSQEPMPPSKLTELPILPDLDAIVLKCLEKLPEDRPAGADQLAELLSRIEVDEPWTRARMQRWWQLHKPG